MLFNQNPYTWSDTAQDVTTVVSQLQLQVGSKDILVKELKEPIRIVIPQVADNQVAINVTLQENFTSYVEFNKTHEESKVLVFLDGQAGELPEDGTIELAIYDFSFKEIVADDEEQLPVYNESFFLG